MPTPDDSPATPLAKQECDESPPACVRQPQHAMMPTAPPTGACISSSLVICGAPRPRLTPDYGLFLTAAESDTPAHSPPLKTLLALHQCKESTMICPLRLATRIRVPCCINLQQLRDVAPPAPGPTPEGSRVTPPGRQDAMNLPVHVAADLRSPCRIERCPHEAACRPAP